MDRKTCLSRFLIVAATGMVAIGPHVARAATYPYTAENLGALPGEADAIPFAINAGGQVVGWSGLYRAFLFTDGIGMVELFGPGGRPSATARGINDAGIVVGESWGGGMPCHAVRWTAGVSEDLGALGESSRAWDINDNNAIVGETPVDALDTDAFIFTDAGGAALLVPTNYTSHAYDINEVGQVAGAMTVGNSYHVFRFTPATGIQDLGVLTGFWGSFGKAINISGQVAGMATSATGNSQRVFRFTDGIGMVNLGGVGETNEVWAMNARGDLVGRGRPTSGIERGFLYTDEGGLQDFTSLIDPALGLRMLYAHDINDAGQIVGLAYDNLVGRWVGVRLTPAIPVGPLADLSVTPVKIEAGQTCTGWVTITQPAPPGGALITLAGGDPGLSVPLSVSVPEGSRHQSFTVGTSAGETGIFEVTAEYGGRTRSATLEVIPATSTGVGGSSETPPLRLHTIAPNPTGRLARVEYELSQPSVVRVSVHDVSGRLVRTLVDARQSAGLHPVVWDGMNRDGSEAPSGTYFVRVQAGAFRSSGKLVLVR